MEAQKDTVHENTPFPAPPAASACIKNPRRIYGGRPQPSGSGKSLHSKNNTNYYKKSTFL
jgi:hypothetical protein